MLIANLAKDIRELLSVFDDCEPLFELLRKFTTLDFGTAPYIEKLASSATNAASVGGEIHNHFAGARSLLDGASPRAIYRSIENLDEGLRRYVAQDPGARAYMADFADRIEHFSGLFESFLTVHKGRNALAATSAAVPLLRDLEVTRINLKATLQQIEAPAVDSNIEESLTFYFSGNHSLTDLAEKLHALSEIFRVFAALLNLPDDQEVVRLVRVETGSAVFELLVARVVSKFAKPWLGAVAGFVYRNYSVEGALASQPKIARESIKQLMDVRTSFVKAGIDTGLIDEKIRVAGEKMASNVVSLIGNQVRFKLDEAEFSISESTPPALSLDPSTDHRKLPKPN